ncbi:large subunit ribosomal protein L30 [Actinobaculum suis]|uniref:Large ribosomal subunit protein uL30 n=1 Tax=Actinobaculum suis TaxID=1657 RepID=A0A0K9EVV3_9ACTO|nr:50S ribosomal protein L30 [Actinobaculum suis]KMY24131.1 50S ribosomal protein L30 [Actinobaculum suis]MDY5153457.1 50S ribosomal protein L30 [Actinobaculum suis]OCA93424.1 50S ribosomal protein L30 [Actinobaculum suis]OCA95290.1 50S ribosomal protein L30 [Actinobaculum suis]SDE18682.1 large subunit ribosomal protein L30 [Actinobaculum suis]
MAKLKITQVRGTVGQNERQRENLRTLGLRKIGQSVEHEDTPIIRGILRVVAHLVEVEEA